MSASLTCPLCLNNNAAFYFQDKKRTYHQCGICELVFVDPADLPDRKTEKDEYDLHENHSDDPVYHSFLSRLAQPLISAIRPGLSGLDFGCGPAPVLADILTQAGMSMSIYDSFYFPDRQILTHKYDFITCTEAIEHFHTPHVEWKQWHDMLKPGGVLAVMTKRVLDKTRFATWHYKNDITHVSFFSDTTFEWLAQRYNYRLQIISADIVFLHKSR